MPHVLDLLYVVFLGSYMSDNQDNELPEGKSRERLMPLQD